MKRVVLKGVRMSSELQSYTIDLSAIELERLHRVLESYGENRAPGLVGDTEECMFATKFATLINNAFVLNGD